MAKLRDLTPEEQTKTYAKYYRVPPMEPDPAMVAQVETGPLDPALALMPEQVNDLLTPERLAFDGCGWWSFENGGGLVATCHRMPGLTRAMLDWWFCWHPLEDLRYKIWYPPTHYGIHVEGTTRARLLDESIPLDRRNYGCIHQVCEDIVDREDIPEPFPIHFRDPVEIGFDPALLAEHPEVSIYCAFVGEEDPPVPPERNRIMCHVVRDVPGGVEFRSRVWRGWAMREGRPKLMLPPGAVISPISCKLLALHNVAEYTNLKHLLPALYAEEGAKRPLAGTEASE